MCSFPWVSSTRFLQVDEKPMENLHIASVIYLLMDIILKKSTTDNKQLEFTKSLENKNKTSEV